MLPQYPVVTLSEIRVDAARSFGSETVIASDRYFVESAAGLVHLKSGVWLAGDSVVRVTYTAGYASDAIPSDLKTACLITAADLWSRSRLPNRAVGRTSHRSIASRAGLLFVQKRTRCSLRATGSGYRDRQQLPNGMRL